MFCTYTHDTCHNFMIVSCGVFKFYKLFYVLWLIKIHNYILFYSCVCMKTESCECGVRIYFWETTYFQARELNKHRGCLFESENYCYYILLIFIIMVIIMIVIMIFTYKYTICIHIFSECCFKASDIFSCVINCLYEWILLLLY